MHRLYSFAFAFACASFTACGARTPEAAPARQLEIPKAQVTSSEAEHDLQVTSTPHVEPPGDMDSCVRGLRDAEELEGSDGWEHYSEGLAAERAGDLQSARKSYFLLVQKAPGSALIPLAYLAFGELFRKDADDDPTKVQLAAAAYREVTKYPPPGNPAYAYSWLRMGDTHAKDDPTRALDAYLKALKAGQQHSGARCAPLILFEAKRKLTTVYADVGQASKAHVFFSAAAGEAAALLMLEDLVESYRRQNNLSDACVAAKTASSPRLSKLAGEVCTNP